MAQTPLQPTALDQRDALLAPETPWQEFVRIYKKDWLAVAGVIVLGILLFSAFAGKALTEWMVVFDAEVVSSS